MLAYLLIISVDSVDELGLHGPAELLFEEDVWGSHEIAPLFECGSFILAESALQLISSGQGLNGLLLNQINNLCLVLAS